MACCATCGKRIGVFFGRSWRRIDKAKHCLQCFPLAAARRREATLSCILAAGEPQVFLAAPVISRDLDAPSNDRRYTGAVLLTDRGVIFSQHGQYKKGRCAAALFGLLGAILDGLLENRRRAKASPGLGDVNALNAMDTIHDAEHLFFFPSENIREMKGDRSYMELKLAKGSVVFRWMNPRQSIKPHLDLVKTYASAVNQHRDPIADCAQYAAGPL